MKSILIGLTIQFISVIQHVSADYELILSQKDVRTALFDSGVRTSYLENEDDPDADTFTNIGELTASDFADDSGYYTFKLIYTNLHNEGETNKVDNTQSVTLEWKQTSWLTATTITGYTPINVPTETRTDSGSNFEGLGLSSRPEALLDGDAHGHSHWYNSAGTITLHDGGIPAFNRQVAFTAALYVYAQRDCSILDIDGFLTECSDEFSSQISSITDSITELEAVLSTNITNLDGRVTALENDGDNIQSEIQTLTDGLTATNERIDAFGVSAAKAPSMGFIDSNGGDDNLWLNGKDIFIISLLLINFIGMIYIYYLVQSKESRSFKGKKYAVQFDEETDMEPINK